jgi:DNA repair exonuclease SbcCD nuclease subunit
LKAAGEAGKVAAMTFRFIHTADWQLGKPFANFPADLAGELSAARFNAIERIAGVAAGHGASHVLVAGDVFDGEDLANATVRRALERMAEFSAVTWVLLPGNHDPARPGGIWDRIKRFGFPANVLPILVPEPVVLAAGVYLLPAPLTTKNPGRDPTLWMQNAATPAGAKRIGLAHGSIQGFGSDGESAVLIAKDRAPSAGLTYLALGDWHGIKQVSPETWYSGTPEPDRYPSNEPGYVLAVTLEGNSAVKAEKVPSAQFSWAKKSATLNSSADLATLESSLTMPGAQVSRSLVQLTLSGSLSLSEHAALDDWCETWSGRLRHLEVERSLLAVRLSETDFDSLGSEGPLLDAARRLAVIAADPVHKDHPHAPLALQRLFGFAAEAVREGAA